MSLINCVMLFMFHYNQQSIRKPTTDLFQKIRILFSGPLEASYRAGLLQKWCDECQSLGISFTKSFNFVNLFGDPIRQLLHQRNGLPKDLIARQNVIIMEKSQRWPYFIDPQHQARKWLKKIESSESLITVSTLDPCFDKELQRCIQTGTPILVEHVE